MSRFYRPYPNEFYAINDLLPEHFLENQPHITINTIDYKNRCINFNAIHSSKKCFSDNVIKNVLNFLKEHVDFVENYICELFSEPQRRQYATIIKRFAKMDSDSLHHEEKIELHHVMVDLYHSFPCSPQIFLDGILRKIETRLAKKGSRFRYATITLLDRECRPPMPPPWARMRFYGFNSDEECIEIPIDSSGGFAWEIEANQFDLSIRKRLSEELLRQKEAKIQLDIKNKKEAVENGLSSFFYSYLYPLFIDPNFDGLKIQQDVTELPFRSFIVLPIYSAELPSEGCFGTIIGHIFLSFRNEAERIKYLEPNGGNLDQSWDTISTLILQTLLEGRSHLVANDDFLSSESLKDLLANMVYVQDWERILVFATPTDKVPEYCFKRFPGEEKNWVKYGQIWDACEDKSKCQGCIQSLFEEPSKVRHDHRKVHCSIDHEKYFFTYQLNEILKTAILPTLESEDMDKYRQHVLVFEFPECTFLPLGTNSKKDALEKLGDHYIKRLIPIFDRVLMKRKVLKHSLTSAVAAIISRNHSHHIGSHVTPRCGMGKVMCRLEHLGKKDTSYQQQVEIGSILKSRLDQYIQKKADFLSEIATEPLTTTKTLGFFNEIILPFIQNTLLMDNIGANEGVNYSNGKGNENRLRIHVFYEDRELWARFNGGISCSCDLFTHLNFPYSSHCGCRKPLPLQVKLPEMDDIFVAVPGPLGEFAVYSFFENLIRNAVKHNYDSFRDNPDMKLDINIKISEFAANQLDSLDFYRLEVWEDVTRSGKGLKERLRQYIEAPIVDSYGQLKRQAWGIAEMKIMANLLGGSDDFLRIGSSLKVKGKDRLVYEFKMMKPKEIAVISDRFEPNAIQLKGEIRWFSTTESFLRYQKRGSSPAAFNMLILDKGISENVRSYSHLFPNRVLAHYKLENLLPGTITINDNFFKSIQNLGPGEINYLVWGKWLEGLQRKSNFSDELRLAVFFGQDEETKPTKCWIAKARELEAKDSEPRLSVIYRGKVYNDVSAQPSRGQKLLVFDRHFDGYGVFDTENIVFHEAFDKNSLDFVPVFSASPTNTILLQLIESAYLNVLILDERISEVAYEEILHGESDKPIMLYGSKKRIEVNRWGNIFISTHLQVNSEKNIPLHHSVGDNFPRILVEITTGEPAGKRIKGINAYWIASDSDQKDDWQPLQPHIIIIHQGVVENYILDRIPKMENEDLLDVLKEFFEELREYIPYIIVDSGRGIPANLPPQTKFMPFSLIEDFFMKDRVSKFSLIKILMSLTRRG